MRALIVMLMLLTAVLQHKVWFSEVGHAGAVRLRVQLAEEAHRADQLAERNRRLTAEVLVLKSGADDGYAAVEARARSDLGMVRKGEIFYLVADHR